jgi:kelch-like protein 10
MLALRNNELPYSSGGSTSEDDDDAGTMPHQCMSSEAMQKLFQMRLNNQLCDAIIRVDNDRSYNIHRAILCACSTYFR